MSIPMYRPRGGPRAASSADGAGERPGEAAPHGIPALPAVGRYRPRGDGGERPAVPPLRRASRAPKRRRPSRLLVLARRLRAVALTAGVAALVAWPAFSPRFALAHVVVEASGDRVSAEWVADRLSPLTGRNLLQLPAPEVEERLAEEPWLAGIELHKQLPDTLRINVRQRRAEALVVDGNERWWADAAGRLIAPAADLDAARSPLPRILDRVDPAPLAEPPAEPGEPGARATPVARGVPAALALATELERSLPAWAAGLRSIEVLSDDEFRLETEALPFALLVEGRALEARSRRLNGILDQLLARYPGLAEVDLRYRGKIIVRPHGDGLAPAPAATGEEG